VKPVNRRRGLTSVRLPYMDAPRLPGILLRERIQVKIAVRPPGIAGSGRDPLGIDIAQCERCGRAVGEISSG